MSAPANSAARIATLEAQLQAVRTAMAEQLQAVAITVGQTTDDYLATAGRALNDQNAPADVRSIAAHAIWIAAFRAFESWATANPAADAEWERLNTAVNAFWDRLAAFSTEHGLPAPAPYDG